MFTIVSEHVFPFLRTMAEDGTAHAAHMKGARFTIPTPGAARQGRRSARRHPDGGSRHQGRPLRIHAGKIATAGQNGQFRTPRHIIALMVEMMAPTPKDVICDPACGTCGFLVAAGEYLRDNHPKLFHDEETPRPFPRGDVPRLRFRRHDAAHRLDEHDAARRRGSRHPLQGFAGAGACRRQRPLSLVLANPPFAGSLDYETTAKDLLAIVKTKKTELLFMALFLKLLKPGGRAAVIVPDGVLFGSSTAHKEIRTMLVEDHKLDGIVKLPSGVFRPYAGVSTAIVLFTKTNSGGTDHVWFYDCQADGFSLDDKRNAAVAGGEDRRNRAREGGHSSTRAADEDTTKNNLPDIAARWARARRRGARARPHRPELLRAEGRNRGGRLRPLDQPLQGGDAEVGGTPAAKGDHRRAEGAGERDCRWTRGSWRRCCERRGRRDRRATSWRFIL